MNNYIFLKRRFQVCSCYDSDEKRTLYFVQKKAGTYCDHFYKVRNNYKLIFDYELLVDRTIYHQWLGDPYLHYVSAREARDFIAHELRTSSKKLTDLQIGFLSERDGILLKRNIYDFVSKQQYYSLLELDIARSRDYINYVKDTKSKLDSSYEYVYYTYRRKS